MLLSFSMKSPLRILFLILLCSYSASAQLGGIAGLKIVTFHPDPIPKKTVEFEPTFNVSRSSGFFDRSSFTGSDTIEIESNLSWRLTYGLSDRIEVGMNFQSDVVFGNFDFKVKLNDSDKLRFGAVGGLGVPLGNRSFSFSNPSIDDVSNYTLGIIGTYETDSLTSIDFNFLVTDYFRDVFEISDMPMPGIRQRLTGTTLNMSAEVGSYFLAENILLVGGLGYFTTAIDNFWEAGLFGVSGVAIEIYNNYVFTFGATYTLHGINQPRTLALGFSFTTIWD